MKEFLREQLSKLNIHPDEGKLDQMIRYMELVLEYNENLNLTAITEPKDFVMKHIVDSLAICNVPEFQSANKFCDIGTGAGFPGVPLAIMHPEKEFYLVDSLKKRLNAIGEMTDAIQVNNIYLIHDRAEDAGRGKAIRESFDMVAARAVANLAVLSEYCLPLVKVGGHMVAYKGSDISDELNQAHAAIRILGGKQNRIIPVDTEEFSHALVIIDKVKNTPKTYPRKAGTPSKSPI